MQSFENVSSTSESFNPLWDGQQIVHFCPFWEMFIRYVDLLLETERNRWKINISIQLNIEIPVMFKKNFKN